jgi:hypothetical protein
MVRAALVPWVQVLQGNPEDEPPRELIEKLTDPNGTSRHAVDNGIERPYQVGEGPTYSETVFFVRQSCISGDIKPL